MCHAHLITLVCVSLLALVSHSAFIYTAMRRGVMCDVCLLESSCTGSAWNKQNWERVDLRVIDVHMLPCEISLVSAEKSPNC